MKSIVLATTTTMFLTGFAVGANEPSPEQKQEIEHYAFKEQYELQMKKDLSNLMLKYDLQEG